jgi:hypothetical protein
MITARRPANLPLLIVGAVAMLVAFSIWQTVRFAKENDALRGALVETRSLAPALSSDAAPGSSAEWQQTRADLAQARTRLQAAEAKAAELASTLAIAPAEELKSHGRLEELAGKGVELVQAVKEHTEAIRTAKLEGREANADLRLHDLTGLIVNMEAIGKLEANPAEVAELHAQALKQMLDLDSATSQRVRERLAAEFEQLRVQGLDRLQRPALGEDDWYARRDQTLQDAAARIEALIPPGKRSPNAVLKIMNLSTGLRTRIMRYPGGPPGNFGIFYQEPGSEPIRVEARL